MGHHENASSWYGAFSAYQMMERACRAMRDDLHSLAVALVQERFPDVQETFVNVERFCKESPIRRCVYDDEKDHDHRECLYCGLGESEEKYKQRVLRFDALWVVKLREDLSEEQRWHFAASALSQCYEGGVGVSVHTDKDGDRYLVVVGNTQEDLPPADIVPDVFMGFPVRELYRFEREGATRDQYKRLKKGIFVAYGDER